MENNKTQDTNELKEENISIETLALLLKYKWVIIILMLVSGIGSTLYSLYYVDVQYKSTVNLVPPKTSSDALGGMLGNLGGALKDFGLGKVGGGGGMQYDYMVILEARTVIDSVIKKYNLAKVYDLPDSLPTKVRKAFSSNLALDFLKDGNYLISIWDTDPQRAADMANDFAKIANDLATKIEKEENKMNLKYLEDRVENLNENLKLITDTLARYSTKYKIFSIEDQAKGYADLLTELKSKKYIYEVMYNISKTNFGADDYQTKMQENTINELSKKISQAENNPGAVGNFSMNNATDIGLEFARLYVEFETYSKVKAFLIPTLEKAKLDLNKQVNNLFVVDEAIPADMKDRPKRSLIVLGAVAGSFILSIFLIVVVARISRLNAQLKNYQ